MGQILTKSAEIEWFEPRPIRKEYAITIPHLKALNLNRALFSLLKGPIRLGMDISPETLYLVDTYDRGFTFSKSGVVKSARHVISRLVEKGIHLPARYVMEKQDDGNWVGKLQCATLPAQLPEHTPKKPRSGKLPQ